MVLEISYPHDSYKTVELRNLKVLAKNKEFTVK